MGAIIAVVAIVAVAMTVLPGAAGGGAQMRALVHDGDGGLRELSLAEDSETTVTTSLGTNVVVVEGGAVRVRDADCDNHDCIRQGPIDAPGRQVICLPHRLWIEIVAEGDAPGQMNADAVAGSGSASNGDGIDVTSR